MAQDKLKKLFWFGDSWTSGIPKTSITVFPEIVSKNLNAICVNRGKSGAGYQDIEDLFFKNYNLLSADDVVIFCLTSMYRQCLYDSNGVKHYTTWIYQQNKPTLLEKLWNTDIANDYYCSYLAFKTINLLYYMCVAKGLDCFFVNAFSGITDSTTSMVPDTNWLLDHRKSLADDFFEIHEPEPVIFDVNRVTNDVWARHKEKINRYLIPNDTHPNQEGNDYIANQLTTMLKLKLHDSR